MPKYKMKSIGNGFWGKFAARMMSQRNDYKNENKRLREALEFYANQKHYEDDLLLESNPCDVTIDNGKIARKALEGGDSNEKA